MIIYLAGPVFTCAERQFNYRLATALRAAGHEVDSPQEFCEDVPVYKMAGVCMGWLRDADVVLINCDGPDVDSGTAYEAGYAEARGKSIVPYRTDFRKAGDHPDCHVNLMLAYDNFVQEEDFDELVKKLLEAIVSRSAVR